MWEVQRDHRMRIWGDTPIKGRPAFTPGSTPRPHAPEGFAEKPPAARAPGRPTAREKPVYRAPLTAILTATALLLVETFRSPPLVSYRTRLLRAWPRSFIWARHCLPPPKTLSRMLGVLCSVSL